MSRRLWYRVVEAKVWRGDQVYLVSAYLLIAGVGKAIGFTVDSMADLPGAFGRAIQVAYKQVTGLDLPDTAR